MDSTSLSLIFSGSGAMLQLLSVTLQSFTAFRKSNVEKFLEELIESKNDFSKFEQDENSIRYFFKILDEVSCEANIQKIETWKNATIHLATDYYDFDFKDNFLKSLSSLSVFDLTVLYKAYSDNYKTLNIEKEIVKYFEIKGIKSHYIMQSMKNLASNGLIDETYTNTFSFSGTEDANLENFKYRKNDIGKEFVSFISDIDKISPVA